MAREQAARTETAAILESIAEAFCAVDGEFQFTYVNRRAAEWFGRSREDLLGRHFWTEFPQAVGSESHRQHLRARDTGQAVRYEAVSPLTGKWIEVSIYPRGDGLSVYFRDIGERKAAEQAEKRAFDHTWRIADALQAALL